LNSYAYLLRTLVERGPQFLWIYFREAIGFDLLHGTNTHLRRPKQPVGREGYDDGLLYVASLTSTIKRSLRVAQRFLGAQFERCQFVDLGSGKGKTLLVYCAEYAQRSAPRAIGIEYSEELCAIARKNLSKMKIPAERATIVCDSAVNVLQYCDKDRPLVVYLYNSFQGRTLREVIGRLASVPHVLIYVDPVERAYLEETGYASLAFEQGRYHASTWFVATKGFGVEPGKQRPAAAAG
jgi:16S rRNA G966 N2-methylase RsmD